MQGASSSPDSPGCKELNESSFGLEGLLNSRIKSITQIELKRLTLVFKSVTWRGMTRVCQ